MEQNLTEEIDQAFGSIPAEHRDGLLAIRDLIIAVAQTTPEIGQLEETLKWGQPSYLPRRKNIGSTLRLGVSKSDQPAIFVTCSTNLIDQIRTIYPDSFDYQGNRAIALTKPASQVSEELRHVIGLILTYQLRKK